MRELNMQEVEQVSGAGFWTDLGMGVGGAAAIGGGVIYTLSTGGVGGVLGGGALIAGGAVTVSSAFNSAYTNISISF
jgi:hypothetical protein